MKCLVSLGLDHRMIEIIVKLKEFSLHPGQITSQIDQNKIKCMFENRKLDRNCCQASGFLFNYNVSNLRGVGHKAGGWAKFRKSC